MATHDVRFERLMSFRPQVGEVLSGKEPCLRDLILHYYASHGIPVELADTHTKTYIEKLWQANLLGT